MQAKDQNDASTSPPRAFPAKLTPYLYFRGNCEEALRFYVRSGLGEIRELRRYEGTPAAARAGAEWNAKVLHSELEGSGVRLFASDGSDSEPMKGCALLLELDDVERARATFAALSVGGDVTVAFEDRFWGWYGNFTDRFGVQWALLVRPRAGQ
jgi:PhnB protein